MLDKFEKRIIIEPLYFPVDGYTYHVKELYSVDGENFYYTGHGTYTKTLEEANKVMEEKAGA